MTSGAAAAPAAARSARPLIVVSNREPYLHTYGQDRCLRWSRTPGGVSVALDALMCERGGTWIAHGAGPADRDVVGAGDRLAVPPDDPRYVLRRVWLSDEEERRYYGGFSNEGLWPLCHEAHVRPAFRAEDWSAYQQVNRRFAAAVDEELPKPRTPVFIQDYHLALVAAELRRRRPEARTALFWHIPWPHPDRLRICPWRKELLRGLLANDLVSFQMESDRRNFVDAAREEVGAGVRRGVVVLDGHVTRATAVPIGVNYDRILGLATREAVEDEMDRMRCELAIDTPMVGVGVDRLDYTKGIPERLDAIDRLLSVRPELRDRLTFVQIGVPSRSKIASYRRIEAEIDRKVAEINLRHRTAGGHAPIRYHKAALPLQELVALFRLADFCIVSSLHDGMNLVAKEFVAARQDLDGVLVLSEMAGAAQELTDAVLINPYDVDGFARALSRAVDMPRAERRARMQAMQTVVAGSDVFAWASGILESLERHGAVSYPGARGLSLAAGGAALGLLAVWTARSGRHRQWRSKVRRAIEGMRAAPGADPAVAGALDAVARGLGGRRLLLLSDFDGTLCDLKPAPEAVWLESARGDLLTRLARRDGVTVGLVSGRRIDDLRERARIEAPIYYAGLHGLEIAGIDSSFVHERATEARGLLQVLARALDAQLSALAGVRLENKDLSVAVHTRLASPADRAEARRIVERIVGPHVERSILRMLPGSAVLEIMPNIAWTKGDAVLWIRTEVERRHGPAWPVYVGNDVTDEDAFRAIGDDGLTIVVGNHPSLAELRLPDPPAVEAWLRGLADLPLSTRPDPTLS